MTKLADLKVKIFADGADLEGIKAMYAKPWIKGFTTNPTLMRKAGITDYKSFALRVLELVPGHPRGQSNLVAVLTHRGNRLEQLNRPAEAVADFFEPFQNVEGFLDRPLPLVPGGALLLDDALPLPWGGEPDRLEVRVHHDAHQIPKRDPR